jgi:hypothetical protein
MKRSLAMLAAIAAIAFWLPVQTQAQGGGGGGGGGRGNFDPEQMRQRMMERYKETLKADDEAWKVIEPRIQKVTEARREVGAGGAGMRGMMMGQRRPGGDNQDQGQNRRANFGPQPSAAAQDLQKAVESNASADQIKSKLAAYREDRKAKQEKLDQAQAELKKVLSVKQEAMAVVAGLLD